MKERRRIICTITLKCNNNCLNCFIPYAVRHSGREISPEKLKRLLLLVGITNQDRVEITGGEPTCHSDLLPILAFVHQNNPGEIVLITNAERCALASFSDPLTEFVDEVVSNIYSVKETVHDQITRTPGSFLRKINGLRNLNERGVKISLKIIPLAPTYKDIPQLVEFVSDNFHSPHFVIKTTDFSGLAEQNSDKIGVPLSIAAPYIEKSVERLLELGITVDVFFPLCLLKDKFWHLVPDGWQEISRRTVLISPNRGLKKSCRTKRLISEKCANCSLAEKCFWFEESYISIFGDRELNPH